MLDKFRSFSKTIFAKMMFGVLLVAFVVWGVGNVGHNRNSNVAAFVGKDVVTIRDLQVAYSQELGRIRQAFGSQVSEQQLKQLGLIQRALNNLVMKSMLTQAANDMGVTTSKDAIIRKMRQDPSFQTADGKFDSDKFRQLLESNGLTESQFIALISTDLNQQQYTSSLFGGITADKTLVKFYDRFANEIRSADYVEIIPASISIPAASDDEIKKFYNDHKEAFSTPEYRSFSYVVLNQKEIADSVKVTDEEAKQFYDANKQSFGTPEQRDLVQLIFANEETAKKGLEYAKDDETFADIVEGFDGADKPKLVNVNKASKSDLLAELQEPIFSAEENGVVGPFKTALGWHLVKVKAIYESRVKPFNEVSNDIKSALKSQRSADAFYDVGNRLDDMLAGGSSLADAAKELGVEAKSIPAVNRMGKTPNDTIAFDKPEVLAAAYALGQSGEASSLQELGNKEGYFVVQLNEVKPSTPKDLETVKSQITAGLKQQKQWAAADEKLQKLLADASEQKSLAKSAEAAGLAVKSLPAQKRTDANKLLGPQGINALFDIPSKGMTGSTRLPDRLIAMEITDIRDDKDSMSGDEQKTALENLKQQNAAIIFDELRAELLETYKVKINDRAIQAVFN